MKLRTTALLAALVAVAMTSVALPEAQADGGDTSFSIGAFRHGRVVIEDTTVTMTAPGEPATSGQDEQSRAGGGTTGGRLVDSASLGLRLVRDGTVRGVANLSLLTDTNQPSAVAVSFDKGVKLSWDAEPAAEAYVILRDDTVIAKVSTGEYLDASAPTGRLLTYRISAITPDDVFAASHGITIVRAAGGSESQALAAVTAAAANRTNANVVWRAFIRQQYIDSPGDVLCDYSDAYKFGGDNRGFSSTGTTYRTMLQATVYWNASGTMSSVVNIGATKVYKKSTGALVATKTASSSGLSVQRLAQSTATRVELYFKQKASNPFCTKLIPNAIEGYFRVAVTQTGSFTVLAGAHLQMPAHEIYIWDNSTRTTIYTRSELSAVCLVKIICDQVTIQGSGTY